MPSYKAPLRDITFVAQELLDLSSHYQQLAGCEAPDAATFAAIVEEGAKFAEQVLAPLNAVGDQHGCQWQDGKVSTPPGFADAFQRFAANGWLGLDKDPIYGGQGLPPSLGFVNHEMVCSANHAWGMYGNLTGGAISTLSEHADAALRQRLLPPMIAGRWSGTMCLTEAHCGSDLGLLRTSARPEADGSYRINGSKIFISAGEHDLTENIVHLVLARIEGAPAGVKGISLFAVPKRQVDEAGNLGQPNGVSCGAIEHKMGIHGNATCVLNFDGATGYLLGEANRGLNAMFTYINESRLAVSQQAQAHAEASFQGALAYARDRLQMRTTPRLRADQPADPIIGHADVRRMLLTQKAYAEGGRMLAYTCAKGVDLLHHGATPGVRQAAARRLALLTPIAKGFLTETGNEAAQLGIQVFGGHGFIREWGMEQIARDVRITAIYEGTNTIQGIDLLTRKVLADGGEALSELLAEIETFIHTTSASADLAQALHDRVIAWREVSEWLSDASATDANLVGASAYDYLMLCGYTLIGYLWLRAACVAEQALAAGSEDIAFYQGKRETARFYLQRLLPRASLHETLIRTGSDNLMRISDSAFAR
ncbi:acyl-CoA dehydrogenase C-terminal domain-containing protein [Pseudomonas sp. 39004]|jgi:alkylation response protein AidB-like acyl-CoA dehydrogenase|uniref:acyl-CoA dehydrogenase C-terminal domain-containing protein n=1 Tax=unclassified Pseudomonas TaxID=196821 RepID=UPI002363B165|nr:acyl-CoA dehydrogenase C-terminal domain-containing protein [Pseudomonas sp. 39004]MDD1959109.1 acyl-CoA dehydrogenase C-terminal domain-containing protein [Pseudomonas sp. 39004]